MNMNKKEFAEPEVLVIRVEDNDVMLLVSDEECGAGGGSEVMYSNW